MAEAAAETVLPLREGEGQKKAAAEQEINPWDVQAGTDENGNALQFDYMAISQYVFFPSRPPVRLSFETKSFCLINIENGPPNSLTKISSNGSNVLPVTNHTAG